MKKLFLLAFFSILANLGFSQALSTYTFSAFSSTYAPVSGSFISASGGTGWGTSAWDDCYYNSISIGFNFVYCGATYTSISASQNCWLTLGHTFPTSVVNTYDNDLTNTAIGANLPRPILAALWTDTKTSGACVRYATTGTAPNRVFTIEWYHMGFYSTSSSWATPSESVEIILYETSNIIDFAYDNLSSHSYSTSSCAIGITGGTAASGTGTQPAWSLNSISSPAVSMSTITRYLSGQPGTNQVYRWSPCGITLAPTNDGPICSGGTVNFSGTLTGGTASGYSWSGPTSFSSTSQNPSITGVTTSQAGIYTFTATSTSCTVTATTTLTVDSTPTATISGTTAFCSGNSSNITFTGTAGATVNYNINGGGTLSVTLSAAGTATVSTGTLTTGTTAAVYNYSLISATLGSCSQTLTGSAIVTVNPVPSTITGTTTVCVGSTTTLSDADAGGTWSTGSTSIATVAGSGTSAVITGVSSGSATITYLFASTGCLRTMSVTVNPTPAVISGPSAVCLNSSITLTDASASGTWSSSNTGVASVSTGGTVSGTGVGTATITYAFGTGCNATKSITVNSLPATITGANNVCEGGSVTTLADATTGGSWSSSSTVSATVNSSGDVTGVTAGSTTITYTIGTGCYQTMAMTVNPLPGAITGSTSVCDGSTVTLTNGSGTGTWTSSNTAVATAGSTTGIITGVTAGSTVITFMLSTGCITTTAFTVNPLPPAISGPSSVCEGGSTITLSNSVTGGSWASSATTVATAGISSGIITGVSAGTVTITYTHIGCNTTTSITVLAQPGAIVTPLGDTMMCPGSFVVLASSVGSGYSFQWNNSTGPISGATDDYYLTYSGSNYSVSILNSLGCTTVSRPVAVTVNPATASVTTTGTSPICQGSVFPLNANTGTGLTYQWIDGTTAISGATGAVFNATASGNYNVIVSNAAGCSATSSPAVSLTVLPAPSTTLLATGPLNFCAGDSVIITSDTTAGTVYQWQLGSSSITGATNVNFTATNSGTYNVVMTNSYGCSSVATAVVTAIALPSAAITPTGTGSFCVGGSAALSTPAAAGNTYQWYRNGTVIGGAVTSNYTTYSGGNFKVTVVSSAGCSNTTSPAFYVNEINTPVVAPITTTSFCWGGNSVLQVNVASTAGVSFQWQIGGANISGATDNTYSAVATGDYSCVVTVSGSCTIGSNAVSVVQFPLPNPVVVYDGITLGTQNYYVTYQWFRNLVPVTGIGPMLIPSDTGTYTVRVIDTNGCQSVSTGYIVTKVGGTKVLGINKVTASDISIFPNPANDIVHIVSPEKLKAVISAADGRKIIEQENAVNINISSLAEGVYMLMLIDSDGQIIKVEKMLKN